MIAWLYILLIAVVSSSAQLTIHNALYVPILGQPRPWDSPSNYSTLGAWFLAEDVATNDGSKCCSNWTSRIVPLTIVRYASNDVFYYNSLPQSPHVVKFNPQGLLTTGFSNATIKVGSPVAGKGFTWLMFGRSSTNPNNAPMWFKTDFNQQFRANIANTNEMAVFLTSLGTIAVQAGNAFTNTNYKVLCFVYSNNFAITYQNLVNNSVATLGVDVTLDTLQEIGGNFDWVELAVWTNNALNPTQYTSLYSNYFKRKYPDAGL